MTVFIIGVIISSVGKTYRTIGERTTDKGKTETTIETTSVDSETETKESEAETLNKDNYTSKISNICYFYPSLEAFVLLNDTDRILMIYDNGSFIKKALTYSEFEYKGETKPKGFYYCIYNGQIYAFESDLKANGGAVYYSIPGNQTQVIVNYNKDVFLVTLGESKVTNITPKIEGYDCQSFYVDDEMNNAIFFMSNNKSYRIVLYNFASTKVTDITDQLSKNLDNQDISISNVVFTKNNIADIVLKNKVVKINMDNLEVVDESDYNAVSADAEIVFQKNAEGVYAYNCILDKQEKLPDISDVYDYEVLYTSDFNYIVSSKADGSQWLINYKTGKVSEFTDIDLSKYHIFSVNNELLYGEMEYAEDDAIPANYYYNVYKFE